MFSQKRLHAKVVYTSKRPRHGDPQCSLGRFLVFNSIIGFIFSIFFPPHFSVVNCSHYTLTRRRHRISFRGAGGPRERRDPKSYIDQFAVQLNNSFGTLLFLRSQRKHCNCRMCIRQLKLSDTKPATVGGGGWRRPCRGRTGAGRGYAHRQAILNLTRAL